MTKSILRTIKKSLGRYLAILAIIALGSSFFAGLIVSRPSMIKTMDDYVDRTNFFDWRMISTLGYDDEAVAAFAAAQGVSAAEGALSIDFLWQSESGSDVVIKAHSIPENINKLELTSGRMPERSDECLVDWAMFSEDPIGRTIRLSPHNEEDTLDHFTHKEYTVVGTTLSPFYINHERGTSTLGNGSAFAFVYIPLSGFDMEVYTEVYITLAHRGGVYTQELKNLTDASEAALTELAEAEAHRRYQEILAEAESEWADGKKEYDDGLAEYHDGLAEYHEEKAKAERDLAEAWEELSDAEQSLAEGWEEFRDGVNTLIRELTDAEQELHDGEQKLADALLELEDAEQEYTDGLAELEQAEQDYKEAQSAYEDGLQQINDAEAELDSHQSQLDAASAALREGEAQLEAGKKQLESSQAAFDQSVGAMAAMFGMDSDSFLAALAAGDPAITGALAAAGRQPGEILAGKDGLEQGWAEYCQSYQMLQQNKQQLASASAQLSDAWAELLSAREELDEGGVELRDGRRELDDAWAELSDARKQLDDAWEEYKDGLRELEEGRAELVKVRAESWTKLGDAQKELEEAEVELADGWAEYRDGRAEADEEFADAEADLAEAAAELADAEAELADARREIDEIETPDVYVLGRGSNIGYACFENDTQIIAGIAKVFPLFFFLVAALVCITTMTRMVDEERTEIGIMKAMGFSSAQIISKYLIYSGSASLLGCVLGFAAGSYVFPYIIWMAYCIMYGFSGLLYHVDFGLGITATLAYLAISSFTTWMACRSELRHVPAQLIRPKAPKAGKRIFLERITFLWKRVPFLHKVSIRNIIRYKQRLFMMILGIGGCTALILTGYGVRDSVADIVGYQYEEICLYDYTLSFADPHRPDTLDQLLSPVASELETYQLVYQSTQDVEANGIVKSTNLIAPAAGELEDLVSFHLSGTPVAYPDVDEAIICTSLAESLKLAVGDSITLRDSDMNSLTLRVSGIFENYVGNYVYIRAESYQNQWGYLPEMKTAYVNRAAGKALDEVASALLSCDGVTAVTASRDMADRVGNMMSALDYVVWLIIGCSGALAFIVLYNLTNINITERIREIATIKVLGFYPGESASYVFRENLVLTAMGALIGLPAGVWFLRYVMSMVKIDAMYFPARVLPPSYAWALVFTFLFAAIVNTVMYFKLERIHMAEALKSVE